MLDAINLQKYANLLVETLPVAITNAGEHEKLKATIDRLMKKGEENLSPEETEILRLVSVLVADFEKRAFGYSQLAPHVILESLLEENFMKQKDLLPIFKTETAISEVMSGKRPISRTKAERLAELFHVSYKQFV